MPKTVSRFLKFRRTVDVKLQKLVTLEITVVWIYRLGRWTCDHGVVGSTPGRVAIKWLVPGWVTVCGQVNHLSI